MGHRVAAKFQRLDRQEVLEMNAKDKKQPYVPYHISNVSHQFTLLHKMWRRIQGRSLTEEEEAGILKPLMKAAARRRGTSKYTPHQGKKECARRVRTKA